MKIVGDYLNRTMRAVFFSFVLLTSVAAAEIIRVPLIRNKSMRQTLLESGLKISTILKKVTQAPKPSGNDSVALSKYLDNEFFGIVRIGHPGQIFNIIFDTAWANAFVPSSRCSIFDPVCAIHNKYDSYQSSTYVKNGDVFHVPFPHNRSLEGFLSSDKVNFAHLNIPNFTFAEITSLPVDFLYTKADGVFGMAYASLAVGKVSPFPYRLWKDGIIKRPVFSIYFNRDPTTSNGGSLFLGGSDSKHFNGSFTYLPVTELKYWKIRMDGAEVKDRKKNLTLTMCVGGCDVILNTGTLDIQVPPEELSELNALLSASKVPYIGSYVVPCNIVNKLPEVSFIFARQPFVINSDQYIKKMSLRTLTVCVSAFVDSQPFSKNLWIVGGAFMSKYYTEFNMEKNTVGFAKANL